MLPCFLVALCRRGTPGPAGAVPWTARQAPTHRGIHSFHCRSSHCQRCWQHCTRQLQPGAIARGRRGGRPALVCRSASSCPAGCSRLLQPGKCRGSTGSSATGAAAAVVHVSVQGRAQCNRRTMHASMHPCECNMCLSTCRRFLGVTRFRKNTNRWQAQVCHSRPAQANIC